MGSYWGRMRIFPIGCEQFRVFARLYIVQIYIV